MSADAIVLEDVTKFFKKSASRREYTTLKTEFVRLLKGERRAFEPPQHIEALKGVSFRVPRGKTVGIVGRNGSGKSTLLKLMTGIYAPTSGKVDVRGRVSALLELGAGFHPDFTGRENILINGIILGMSRAEVKRRVDAIIDFAELGDFIDEPVRTYSSGMFMRLAFAVATHVEPEVLIIDEILSVGDEHFSKKSSAKMEEFRKSGKTIVLVTHALNTVETWCDLAVWIDGGKTRMQGDPRAVVAAYRQAIAAAESQSLRTGHSALDRPGEALPATPDAPPPSASAVTSLEVKWTQDRLELLVDVDRRGAPPSELAVAVAHDDGREVVALSQPLPELAVGLTRVSVVLSPLPLGAGRWRVSCGAGGVRTTQAFDVVVAPAGVQGLLAPRCELVVPGRQGAEDAPHAVAAPRGVQ